MTHQVKALLLLYAYSIRATAVFNSTPSAPISRAIVASDVREVYHRLKSGS